MKPCARPVFFNAGGRFVQLQIGTPAAERPLDFPSDTLALERVTSLQGGDVKSVHISVLRV
jgi:hypothetical protein